MQTPAKITIGGNIPHHLIGPLCAQIRSYGQFKRGWAGRFFRPTSEGDINVAVAENQARHLGLYDKEAVDGEFASLETFLLKNGIHFDRCGDGRLVRYRGGDVVSTLVNTHGVTVNGAKLLSATDLLKQADKEFQAGRTSNAITFLREATTGLQQLTPTVAPLEPFEVVHPPADVFFPGEQEAVIDAVRSTVVQHSTTVENLIQVIKLAGKLADHGLDAANLLITQLAAWKDKPATGELNTEQYRFAPSGVGEQAATWKDKPHQLIYDLCGEIERLRSCPATVIIDIEQGAIQGVYGDSDFQVLIVDWNIDVEDKDDLRVIVQECKPICEMVESTKMTVGSHNEAVMYRKFYKCGRCGYEWEDTWSCLCNDRCPECNTETEPHSHEEKT
jgi:hypothetical protein